MLEYFRRYSHRYIVCNFVLLPAHKIVSKQTNKKNLVYTSLKSLARPCCWSVRARCNSLRSHYKSLKVCGYNVKVRSYDAKYNYVRGKRITQSDPPVRGKTPSDTTITKNGHGRSQDNRHDDVDPKSRKERTCLIKPHSSRS